MLVHKRNIFLTHFSKWTEEDKREKLNNIQD